MAAATNVHPAVTVAIGEARLHGDLKENAEYHAPKDRQGWIEGQIVQIGDMIARAQVIDVTKLSGTQVKSARKIAGGNSISRPQVGRSDRVRRGKETPAASPRPSEENARSHGHLRPAKRLTA